MPLNEDPNVVLPFVVTDLYDGPFDNVAYVHGWEAGALDVTLQQCAAVGPIILTRYLHEGNLPMVDLIGMQYDFHIAKVERVSMNGEAMVMVVMSNLPIGMSSDG